MYTERELRKVLENWDIDKDLPISDIFIMDGAKVSGNVWTVGKEYILKAGDREKILKTLIFLKHFKNRVLLLPFQYRQKPAVSIWKTMKFSF